MTTHKQPDKVIRMRELVKVALESQALAYQEIALLRKSAQDIILVTPFDEMSERQKKNYDFFYRVANTMENALKANQLVIDELEERCRGYLSFLENKVEPLARINALQEIFERRKSENLSKNEALTLDELLSKLSKPKPDLSYFHLPPSELWT